ncbi:nucleotidyltransferase domain-containing protein [Jannaschia sp. CCS1]|uniref:nucleotidyltransferase domain-containing protein n=1 Tax=Jannaschia sp. (strain CCS1) TaxID=290400 RepID=UPI000053DCF6|nr:nucleotidyltransferase domain-containing protein [Jannaschia sp. CCS1]ABD54464.1 DNA polymerase beta-like protein [Jannaschia sp. CCS1]
MTHDDVIQAIVNTIRDVPGIRALFLSGSYGNGLADEYSDIDFVLVSEDGATDAVAEAWRNAVEKTGEIVLWWDRTTVPVLINAITEDWTRTDVIILKPDQMGRQTKDALKPLFDHDNIYDTLKDAAPKPGPDLKRFRYEVEEFIRILGLLQLAVGREEYINGVLGVSLLRSKLVNLLIEETDAPNRGGILHLNRLITEDQKQVLISLPPAVPERDAMISAHLAYAAAYLPRARRRAERLGMEWPERFEAVTWSRLEKTLSIRRPYD